MSGEEFRAHLLKLTPRWWSSKRGMATVLVIGGYVMMLLMNREVPDGYAELAKIIVMALFLSAKNGEAKA